MIRPWHAWPWMRIFRLLRAPVREMTIPVLPYPATPDRAIPFPETWDAGEDVVPILGTAWFN